MRPHAAGPNAKGVFGDAAAARNNLIIQGDNLQALKALLPFYRGHVCPKHQFAQQKHRGTPKQK